jgi:hypothetical protein
MAFLNLMRGHPLKHEAIVHHQATHCLNCDTAVSDHFCQHCGQATAAHVPSATEFLHEFVGHYVALEGKLWKTLQLLLFKPGRLTRDYIEGKRVRYVEPLRVYLTLSVLFFALFNFSSNDGINWNLGNLLTNPPAAGEAASTAKKSDEARKLAKVQAELDEAKTSAGPAGAAAIATAQTVLDEAKQEKREKPEAVTPAAPGAGKAGQANPGHKKNGLTIGDGDWKRTEEWLGPKLAHRLDKFRGLTLEQQQHEITAGFSHYLPYAIFAMMPMFALWLKLMYLGSGRLYGEHLLFALHTNAFAFLMLILLIELPAIPFVQPLLGLWLVFYLPTAMRKVYGGSRIATALRWTVLGLLHMLGMALATLGAVALALMA